MWKRESVRVCVFVFVNEREREKRMLLNKFWCLREIEITFKRQTNASDCFSSSPSSRFSIFLPISLSLSSLSTLSFSLALFYLHLYLSLSASVSSLFLLLYSIFISLSLFLCSYPLIPHQCLKLPLYSYPNSIKYKPIFSIFFFKAKYFYNLRFNISFVFSFVLQNALINLS